MEHRGGVKRWSVTEYTEPAGRSRDDLNLASDIRKRVDGPGFEPGASCLQSRRSSELIYPPSVAA